MTSFQPFAAFVLTLHDKLSGLCHMHAVFANLYMSPWLQAQLPFTHQKLQAVLQKRHAGCSTHYTLIACLLHVCVYVCSHQEWALRS